MKNSHGAAKMSPFYITLPFLLFFVAGSVSGIAETSQRDTNSDTTESDTTPQSMPSLIRNYLTEETKTEPTYPLFRLHAERYYPELDVKRAVRLSTFMPGLGQAYAGNYTKATLFLTAELGTFALAGYNIARALHYRDQDVFETGFQDIRTGEFLTPEQGRTRRTNHTVLSGVFLAAGIGLHIWNILDAPQNRRSV